ncbi:MAG: glycosyltransferase family 39 protein [Prolixibacteraceae bacterium]|nr:glycosyltransferase family 39 protein [Prolixibacteraceae bacterium]
MLKFGLRNDKIGVIAFILVFLGLFLYYNLNVSLFYPPQSVHIWRQTNCLSLTQNYYQYNLPFFSPEMHNQFPDNGGSGKSVGEFPLIYYFVAQLWKIFGKHEWIFKLVQNLIMFFGLFALYGSLKQVLKNQFYAVFASLLLFTAPTFVYFGPNFLPDVPSLSFIFIAWFFVIKFLRDRKYYKLWLSALMFCLAMLLKITSAISFVALGGWVLFELLFIKRENQVFKFNVKHFIPFVLIVIPVIAWYLYVDHYNELHGGHFSFHGIWPVWTMDKVQFDRIIDALDKIYFKELFYPVTQYITVGIWIYLMVFIKKLKPVYRYFIIVLPIGFLIQLLLWFQVLEGHDYYMINLYIVFVAVWLVFLLKLKDIKSHIKYIVYGLLVVFFSVNAIKCNKQALDRYRGWMQDDYNRMKALISIEPSFEKWGIEKEHKVIAINDFSINSSLYYMNRKGYTSFGSDLTKPEVINNRIENGAKYLIVTDTTVLSQEYLKSFLKKEIGNYENVFVYDLQNLNESE